MLGVALSVPARMMPEHKRCIFLWCQAKFQHIDGSFLSACSYGACSLFHAFALSDSVPVWPYFVFFVFY